MGGNPTQKEKKWELRDGSVGQVIVLQAMGTWVWSPAHTYKPCNPSRDRRRGHWALCLATLNEQLSSERERGGTIEQDSRHQPFDSTYMCMFIYTRVHTYMHAEEISPSSSFSFSPSLRSKSLRIWTIVNLYWVWKPGSQLLGSWLPMDEDFILHWAPWGNKMLQC